MLKRVLRCAANFMIFVLALYIIYMCAGLYDRLISAAMPANAAVPYGK